MVAGPQIRQQHCRDGGLAGGIKRRAIALFQLDQRIFERMRAVGAARAVGRQTFLFAAFPRVAPSGDAVEDIGAGARDGGVHPSLMGTPCAQQTRCGPVGLVHVQRRVFTPIGMILQVPASRSKPRRSFSVSSARPYMCR
ncbi:hypothetical protein G6F60_014741 [Rhizopus arrhizus]|nr:hypothetical protein G6F60_014741 [Rhizopus arrhizus]